MMTSDDRLIEPRYGRLLDDFVVGSTYQHPWEVTLDEGLLAFFAASFLDPNPLYSSERYARELGFRGRVVHPLVLLNLAISFSVHDVSEQVIAHLAYIDTRFPNAAYAGDTLTASSTVLGVRVSESKPDRGIVHVRTVAVNQDGLPVVTFERKALAPRGTLAGRAHPMPLDFEASPLLAPRVVNHKVVTGELPSMPTSPSEDNMVLPPQLVGELRLPRWAGRPRGLFEDFEPGDVILHTVGRTVGESEHMQLTMLSRNSHPLHFDEVYSRQHSISGTRIVCGPLVFAWIASLASRDTSSNALWEVGFDRGSHPSPVVPGDTLYAASRVVEKSDHNYATGTVSFRLIGVKNERPASLLGSGVDLFADRHELKVFEIDRTVLLPKRGTL
jgi:2-methylfumaryl-CoA hydratase